MIGELFAPDIFSKPRPVFNAVVPAVCADIADILEKHYRIDRDEIASVTGLDGLEINSRNFKVVAGGKTYALKRSGKNARLDDSRNQLEISQSLNMMGASLPRIIFSQDLPYVLRDDGHFWILSDFIEGTYFSGSSAHYLSVMDAVVSLQASLEVCEAARSLPLSPASDSWNDTAHIFEEFFNRVSEWSVMFPESEFHILLQESDHIRACLEKVALYELTSRKNILPTHIDLHPHNILMKNDVFPVIVDIDSLQRTDKMQSLAFAVFKLTRQHIVQEKPENLAAPAQKFMRALNMSADDIQIFYHAAMAEILRRVGIIIALNMRQSNREWNKVLPLQLMALYEVSYIFGQE